MKPLTGFRIRNITTPAIALPIHSGKFIRFNNCLSSFVLTDLEDLSDVRMIESGGRFGFADEALHSIIVGSDIFRKDFQGDFAIEGGVLREVDFAHPARTELVENRVTRDGCPIQ